MRQPTQPIKSLDELQQGDIVQDESYGPCIVHAIGEVPEHPKEALLHPLFFPSVQGNFIKQTNVTIRESGPSNPQNEIYSLKHTPLIKEPQKYAGWQYKSSKGLQIIPN